MGSDTAHLPDGTVVNPHSPPGYIDREEGRLLRKTFQLARSLENPGRGGEIQIRLPPSSEAPRLARRAVEERLADAVAAPVLDDAKLLLSEIVTNSVQHAKLEPDGWIELTLRVDGASGVVRVEVSDPGVGFEVPVTRPDLLARADAACT